MKNKITLYSLFIISIFFNFSCNNDTIITPETPIDPRITVLDAEPSWSPNGNFIAYIGSDDKSGNKLLAIDTNGLNKRRLTQIYGESPNISPNGEWIVYERNGKIYKKRIEGDTITIQLTFEGSSFYPSFSRDGEWIAFDSDMDITGGGHFIWKMRSDGTQKKRIFYTPTLGEARMPEWFPDGIRLVIVRFLPSHGYDSEVSIIDTSGNSISVLTNDEDGDYNPKISPDGQYITWWKSVGVSRIYTMKINGTEQTQISTRSIHPNWSPDGKMIAYTNTIFDDGRIWIMNKDGSSRKKITY